MSYDQHRQSYQGEQAPHHMGSVQSLRMKSAERAKINKEMKSMIDKLGEEIAFDINNIEASIKELQSQ